MTFVYQFSRYRYARLPYRAALEDVMFQLNIDWLFKELPNVFDIADDLFIVGYDANSKDHHRMQK